NQPVNRLTQLQSGPFNNRVWDFVALVHSYGVYFNDAESRQFAWDFFTQFLQLAVFPDGTLAEWYRSHDRNPNQGLTYNYTTLMHVVKVAQTHAVAVENRLPGMTERGKFYDYVTALGTDQKVPNYPGSSTSGGQKGIRQMLVNLSRYHRAPEDGGYLGIRKAENFAPYQSILYRYSIVPAIANSYYQDRALEDYAAFNVDAGYPGPDTHRGGLGSKNWGSWSEHTWGAWGTGYGIGLYAGIPNVFSPTVEELCVPIMTNTKRIALICL
nr:hypothetical protein [Acidiferrobacterales bacterium]